MKIPFRWLKEYIDLTLSPAETAEVLISLGIEVDSLEERLFSFEGVVAASILSVKPHPNAEKLRIATVSDGTETLEVVCGAPNCKAGIKTAWAKIGSTLTSVDGKKYKIKKAKLRDIESQGMLCSGEELGLPSSIDGIIELPLEVAEGTSFALLYADWILEVSLTPNFGHALSLMGIARELSAKCFIPIKKPSPHVREEREKPISQSVAVDIQERNECHHYTCRKISSIEVGPSPDWLKERLALAGQKSINNIVDIATFVMLETGQPLHIFDADTINTRHLSVRFAQENEEILLLDGKTYSLPTETLVIADDTKLLAVAGIMGGMLSSVSPSTKNILIESAHFNPSSIRKSCKKLRLSSESSYRFERGIDKGAILYALDRATSLIEDFGQGIADRGYIQVSTHSIEEKKILCRTSRLNAFLGTALSQGEIADLLQRLSMQIKVLADGCLEVIVPSFRNDIMIEEDLFEEVARLYGYTNLPQTDAKHRSSSLNDSPLFLFEERIRALMIEQGLSECIFCDLISPSEAKMALERGMEASSFIHVLHPSSIEHSVLRPSLLPGFLRQAKYAQDHGCIDLSVFEIGKIHFIHENEFKERMTLGIALNGLSSPYHCFPKTAKTDFFDLKGIIENILIALKIDPFIIQASLLHVLHPFRQAKLLIGDECIGVFGEVHPKQLADLGIKEPCFFAELDLQSLLQHSHMHTSYIPIPIYPSSSRDWTISVPALLPLEALFKAIEQSKKPLLSDAFLIDIYRDTSEKKKVTLRFVYQDKEETLSQEIVDKEHTKLVEQVEQKIINYVL